MPEIKVKNGDVVYLSAHGPFSRASGDYLVTSTRGGFIYIRNSQGRSMKFDAAGRSIGDGSSYYRLWPSKAEYDAFQLYIQKKDGVNCFFRDIRYNTSDEEREAVSAIYDLLVEKGMIQHERK